MTTAQSKGGIERARSLDLVVRGRIAKAAAAARWARVDPRKVLADGELMGSFCRKFGLKYLFAFGSILTPGFGPNSDVDILYVLGTKSFGYSEYCNAVEDLQQLFGRNVDFINRTVIEQSANPFRRRVILDSAKLIYEEAK